jgi:peroxiredoxin (alkyl hydroperoxide reductase subunit C)
MSFLVTKPAPDFTATAVLADNSFDEDFTLSSLHGKYVVLFFYPLDFTFVCPTEILAFDEALEDFRSRDAEVVGVSVDSHYTHAAWKRTHVDDGGIGPIRYPLVSDLGPIRYPLVSDLNKEIARNYGVLLDSVSEALRMLDALRFHELRGDVCPANWSEGDDGIVESQDGIVDYLSKYASDKD